MIVPGTIVVIDDAVDEARKNVVTPLRELGERVLLYDEDSLKPEEVVNPRLVILDWDLMDSGRMSLEANGIKVTDNILKINEKSHFFLVIIWTFLANDKDDRVLMKEKIMEIYNQKSVHHKLRDEDIIIFKDKLKMGDIIEAIREWINSNHSAGLVFEWEKSLHIAKNNIVGRIADKNIKSIVSLLLRSIPIASVAREVSNLFLKLLQREMNFTEEYVNKITEITTNDFSDLTLSWYAGFHNLYNYDYNRNDTFSTGDIFIIDEAQPNKPDNFGLIINCNCDFYQKKVNFIKILRGTKIKKIPEYVRNKVTESDIIPFNYGYKISYDEEEKKYKVEYHKRSDLIDNFINDKLSNRFYKLLFIKDNPNDEEYYHLIFDFNRIDYKHIKLDENLNAVVPKGWKQICRLDSPNIEDLLQKFASYSSRIGLPDIHERYIQMEKESLKSLK